MQLKVQAKKAQAHFHFSIQFGFIFFHRLHSFGFVVSGIYIFFSCSVCLHQFFFFTLKNFSCALLRSKLDTLRIVFFSFFARFNFKTHTKFAFFRNVASELTLFLVFFLFLSGLALLIRHHSFCLTRIGKKKVFFFLTSVASFACTIV